MIINKGKQAVPVNLDGKARKLFRQKATDLLITHPNNMLEKIEGLPVCYFFLVFPFLRLLHFHVTYDSGFFACFLLTFFSLVDLIQMFNLLLARFVNF